MSTKIILFFQRMFSIIDNGFNSGAEFSRKASMNRQNITNWRKKYKANLPKDHPDYENDNDDEDIPIPDLKLGTLLPMIDVIIKETNVSLYWLLTGVGDREISENEARLKNRLDDLNEKSKEIHKASLSQDQILQYLLKNRKEVQSFLGTLPKDDR